MRCETARSRYPDDPARRHTGACEACAAWIGGLERARAAATGAIPPVPEAAAASVMTAVRAAPVPSPPNLRSPRSRRLVRPLAVAASLAVVAVAAAAWIVTGRPTPAEALARAAGETRSAASARFSIQGDASVSLHVPADVVAGLEEGIGSLVQVRKGLPEELDAWRRLLAEQAGVAVTMLGDLAPEIRLHLAGEGAFAPGDRVRFEGSLRLAEPVEAGGDFELVRVGDEVYLRAGEGGWFVGERLPTEILRPVGQGLGRLADWINDDAGRAEPLPPALLDGVETERYSLPLPPEREGETRRADVWVGASDHLIHRVLLVHDLRRPFLTVRARIEVRLRDHGVAIQVEAPVDAGPGGPGLFPAAVTSGLEQVDTWLGERLPGPGADPLG